MLVTWWIMKDPTIKNNTIKEKDVENTNTKVNIVKNAKDMDNDNKKDPEGSNTQSNDNERELTERELKNLLEVQKINRDIKSPEFIYRINSKRKSVNELLKRAISNAARHGLSLKPGTLNNADGECLWESLMYNITQRPCIKHNTMKTPRELKQISITKAQKDTELKKLPFIPETTTVEQWSNIRKDRVYETDLGDFCLIFAARALKRNILIFNTNTKTGAPPIDLIRAEEYEGGVLIDNNPLVIAYDSVHFESVEPISRSDELRAIELAEWIKTKQYKLTHKHTQKMTIITRNYKPELEGKKLTREPEMHHISKHNHKCDVCVISYQGSAYLTSHNRKIHKQNECSICKLQTYGDNACNDHREKCTNQRDKKRVENDKKDRERKQANTNYKNAFTPIMDETTDKIEKITEAENKIT